MYLQGSSKESKWNGVNGHDDNELIMIIHEGAYQRLHWRQGQVRNLFSFMQYSSETLLQVKDANGALTAT